MRLRDRSSRVLQIAPRMASFWHYIGPDTLYWAPRHLVKLWHVKDIYIAGNGCSAGDNPAADNVVYP